MSVFTEETYFYAVGVLFEYVLYRTVLCLLAAGYLSIKPRMNRLPPMSAFTEETCLYVIIH